MANTKDIEVNGVQLRLYKMSPFDQLDLLNTFLPALSGVLRAVSGVTKSTKDRAQNIESIASAVDSFLVKVDPQTRKDLLFKHLLSPKSVKIVISGTELPIVSETKDARAIMSDELNDITYLLQIGGEVLRFNFERFFEFGKSTLARK